MKYLVCLLVLLPRILLAQDHSTDIVYTKTFETKGRQCADAIAITRAFAQGNRMVFFHLRSYTKDKLDESIDTSAYGFYTVNENSVSTKCEWIYQGSRKNGCVVLKGEISFSCKANEIEMELKKLHYYKYYYENGALVLKNEGGYQELDMCKYCNASGMKIGEFVHDNFLRIAASYASYLKAHN
ncbi:MAG: hypothetical protein JSS96_12210 [Bacteroidetes bacterium]|nr:hypothetical protein [Bacteroidota bacterium]